MHISNYSIDEDNTDLLILYLRWYFLVHSIFHLLYSEVLLHGGQLLSAYFADAKNLFADAQGGIRMPGSRTLKLRVFAAWVGCCSRVLTIAYD